MVSNKDVNKNIKEDNKEKIDDNESLKSLKEKLMYDNDEENDNKEKNKDNNFLNRISQSPNIKIYKCIVWKNIEPNIKKDILETISYYRNRSQESNKRNFIKKLRVKINIKEKIMNNNLKGNTERLYYEY